MTVGNFYMKEEEFPGWLNKIAKQVAITTVAMCGGALLVVAAVSSDTDGGGIVLASLLAAFTGLLFTLSITTGLHDYGPNSYAILKKHKELRNERTIS